MKKLLITAAAAAMAMGFMGQSAYAYDGHYDHGWHGHAWHRVGFYEPYYYHPHYYRPPVVVYGYAPQPVVYAPPVYASPALGVNVRF